MTTNVSVIQSESKSESKSESGNQYNICSEQQAAPSTRRWQVVLAENLKFLREQNGKTQGELAVLFGIEQKTISSWECGSRKPPIGTIVSLAKLYRVSLDDLVLTDMRPPIPVYALNLAYLRKKHGMTQQEISELLGYSGKQGYNAIETGKVKPTIDTLEKLADFFGVTMDQIVKQDLSQEVSK